MTEIRVFTVESGNNMAVVWEDNGVGIAEEETEKIFERGLGKIPVLGCSFPGDPLPDEYYD